MTPIEIETAARQGLDMPDGLSSADQLLFQKLRYLYTTFKADRITREQGAREKQRILEQYRLDSFAGRLADYHVKIYNQCERLLIDANKSDCERCKRFARILDGREA